MMRSRCAPYFHSRFEWPKAIHYIVLISCRSVVVTAFILITPNEEEKKSMYEWDQRSKWPQIYLNTVTVLALVVR